jgi:hypothetical protein
MRADHVNPSIHRARSRPALPILLLSAAGLLLPSACAAPVYIMTAGLAVAQVGATAYANGELQTSVFVEFNAAVEAAIAAQAVLDLRPTSTRFEGRSAYISAADLGNRVVTIQITRRTSRVCKVNIRVGFWGDQSMSRLVLSQMQKYLTERGLLPPPPSALAPDLIGAEQKQPEEETP